MASSVDAPLTVVTESPAEVLPSTSDKAAFSPPASSVEQQSKQTKFDCSSLKCTALSGKEYLSSHAAVSMAQIIGVLGVLLAFAAFGFYEGMGRGLAFASGVCGTFTLLINEFVARHRALKIVKSATVPASRSSSGTWA
jgi:hypothetical protein